MLLPTNGKFIHLGLIVRIRYVQPDIRSCSLEGGLGLRRGAYLIAVWIRCAVVIGDIERVLWIDPVEGGLSRLQVHIIVDRDSAIVAAVTLNINPGHSPGAIGDREAAGSVAGVVVSSTGWPTMMDWFLAPSPLITLPLHLMTGTGRTTGGGSAMTDCGAPLLGVFVTFNLTVSAWAFFVTFAVAVIWVE